MENNPNSIANLGRFGLIGVMLALIILAIVSTWCVYDLSTKHIEESNIILSELKSSVTELSTILKMPNRLSRIQ